MKLLLFAIILLTASIAYAVSGLGEINKNGPIDHVVSKSIDVDCDGFEDRIDLNVRGKDFYSQFQWQLKIYSHGKTIYERSGNNERIESFFSDSNYIGGCTGYDDCKYRWYFQRFLDLMIVKMSRENVGVFDREAPNSIYVIARHYLKKENEENPKLVNEAINHAVERLLSGRAVTIVVFDEPNMPTPPMVWMPEFGKFVPVYEE